MTRSTSRAKTVGERVRQPTEIRRRLIVQAARQVIAENGLSHTTMRDIASAGGVSLGTLTYHFSGIDEILTEVLQEETTGFYSERVAAALAAATATDAMLLMVDPFFDDDVRTLQHWRLWLDFWALSAHDAALADWQAGVYERWRADLRTILDRGRAAGEFRFDDADAVLMEFMALFDGLAAHAFLPGSAVRPAAARNHLRSWVARQLLAPTGSTPA